MNKIIEQFRELERKPDKFKFAAIHFQIRTLTSRTELQHSIREP